VPRLASPADERVDTRGANSQPARPACHGRRPAQERARPDPAAAPCRHQPRQPPLSGRHPCLPRYIKGSGAMLTDFFYHLRAHKLPVSVQEYLTLLETLRSGVMPPTLDDFYHVARMTLVKDE